MANTSAEGWKALLNQPVAKKERRVFEGRELVLTDTDKEIWKGITKAI